MVLKAIFWKKAIFGIVLPTDLQKLLPPFKGDTDIVCKEQTERDIVREVLSAHRAFAYQYDCIASCFLTFTTAELCQWLFNFCKTYLPYVAEGEQYQSTRSAAGILATRKMLKSDCKHYSGWCAGILDAVGRINGTGIDWNYRFAGYDKEHPKEHDHVYVVVVLEDYTEIWIDPAPILNSFSGSYVERDFNDRYVIPAGWDDEFLKSKHMLVRLSGASVGDIQAPTGGPSATINPQVYTAPTPSQISDGASALNSVAPGLGSAVDDVLSILPDGGLKDFLKSFVANPEKALMTLIFGRKYTTGDYKLGELYMRNILGLEQVQDNEQVPDGYVPQAWAFFSALMGVRIRTFDDMDALTGQSASQPSVRAQTYLSRSPVETSDISLAAATRAAQILGDTSVSKFNMWENRDVKWPLTLFTSIPYIYPLPGPVENTNFTGIHPVIGTFFSNGYPTDYTGVRTISQNSTVQQPSPVVTASPLPASGTASSASMGLFALVLAGGVFMMGKPKAKGNSVSGPKAKGLGMAVLLLGIGAGVVYAMKSDKRAKLMDYANNNTDPGRKTLWLARLPMLSDSEIDTLYDYLFNYELPFHQGAIVSIPASVVMAANQLYVKYGIPDFQDAQVINAVPVQSTLPVSQDMPAARVLVVSNSGTAQPAPVQYLSYETADTTGSGVARQPGGGGTGVGYYQTLEQA